MSCTVLHCTVVCVSVCVYEVVFFLYCIVQCFTVLYLVLINNSPHPPAARQLLHACMIDIQHFNTTKSISLVFIH